MATSSITRQSGFGKAGLTDSQMRRDNSDGFSPVLNGRMMREPLRQIYIHSVSRRMFVLRRPPLFPKLELRGCDNGERYVTCAVIPDPIPQVSPDNERGGSRIDDNDAWISLIDLLRPGNFTADPFIGMKNPDFFVNRQGTNYVAEGLFPSENKVPSEEELRKAEACRDGRYRWLTREATRLAAKSVNELNEFLQMNPEVHMAMDALGLSASWHQKNEVKAICPNCGDQVAPGIAFHKSSATDMLCVIDPVKAYKAGAINKKRYEELIEARGEDAAPEQ